jgi:hypothetical protein
MLFTVQNSRAAKPGSQFNPVHGNDRTKGRQGSCMQLRMEGFNPIFTPSVSDS